MKRRRFSEVGRRFAVSALPHPAIEVMIWLNCENSVRILLTCVYYVRGFCGIDGFNIGIGHRGR
jgi:hypothetical protein